MKPARKAGWLLLGLLLPACTAPGPFGDGGHTIRGTVKIGLELPLSGEDAPDGIAAETGVDLVIKQAGTVCGASSHQEACFTLQAAPFDDVVAGIHDPARGARNIAQLALDAQVVAVVGPLHDSVAKTEIPVANGAGLALVSPAATNECLTQEPADGHCSGMAARLRPSGPNNFFRVVTTQLIEGDAAAELAYKRLSRRRAFVLNDGSAFSLALAQRFARHFVGEGGAVANPDDLGPVDPQATNLGPQLDAARASGSDVVFFAAGTPSAAGLARLQMRDRMPTAPFISGDRAASDQFAKSADGNAANSFFTVVGPYAPKLPAAQAMVRDYTRAYGRPPGLYSLPAFDATRVVIAAIARAIDDAGGRRPTRQQVLKETALTRNYPGAMGQTSFDANGDTTLRLVTVYEWRSAGDISGHFVEQIRIG